MASKGKPFRKDQSTAPRGQAREIREDAKFARAFAPEAISVLNCVHSDPDAPALIRVAAANEILARTYGKPKETNEVGVGAFWVNTRGVVTDGLSDKQLEAWKRALKKTILPLESPQGFTSPAAIDECGEQARRVAWRRPSWKREAERSVSLGKACPDSPVPAAIVALVDVMRNPDNPPAARVAAAKSILYRAYGKPKEIKKDDEDRSKSKTRRAALDSLSDEELEAVEATLEATVLRLKAGDSN
jgi:hypothetical protein